MLILFFHNNAAQPFQPLARALLVRTVVVEGKSTTLQIEKMNPDFPLELFMARKQV